MLNIGLIHDVYEQLLNCHKLQLVLSYQVCHGIFSKPQDDVVTGTMTPRESIMFSANLRLPPEISNQEKKDRVQETICELGLEKCADTRVRRDIIKEFIYLY